jgi:hypothetical protein
MVNLFIQLPSDSTILSYLSVGGAFWYSVVWSMGSEFVQTIFTNPAAVGNTKVISELIIGLGNLGSAGMISLNWIGDHLPAFMHGTWSYFSGFLVSVTGATTGFLLKAVSSAWAWTWGSVATVITPVVPEVLQPMVEFVFAPIAKGVAVGLIIVVIRLFWPY